MSLVGAPEVALIVHLLLTAGAVLFVGKVMPGVQVRSFGAALVFACVLALLNAMAWSRLTELHGVPHFVSSGLGSFVLNGLLFYGVGKLVPGIEVSGCLTAALGALAVSFLNTVLHETLRALLR